MGISIFGDFSFGIIFQQVSLRMVTHCAGGFGVGLVGWLQALPRGIGVSVCYAFLYRMGYKVKVIKQLSITELVLAYIQK